MSIGILGKKLGMSQFFNDEGKSIPVTLIEAGPCRITQLKSTSTDGYTFNLQLAAGNLQMGVTGLCDSVPFVKIAES